MAAPLILKNIGCTDSPRLLCFGGVRRLQWIGFLDGELNTHRVDRMVAALPPTAKNKRTPRGVLARKDTEDGPLEIILPEDSLWYKAYVSNFLMLEPESSMAKKFRERIRLPYPNFLHLVASVSESELFDRWCGHKRNNKQASPIELLVLGSL